MTTLLTPATFSADYDKVRARTRRLLACLPSTRLDWRAAPTSFSLGDLARHIILIERDLYVPVLQEQPHRYQGCGPAFAPTLPAIEALYDQAAQAMQHWLSQQASDALERPCTTPGGAKVSRRRWLHLLLEHEIHHRGQLYLMLHLLDVQTPPIFGMRSEDLM